ncbi:LacI family DNA-binding transcriptional regulator [Kineococcus glutinatus]|uniref:LacI family DNA-binding transcriptional regulator n=1 Tax=Kineococcus glutinatus TaxID=1070872 RepID=A0ABP9H980_9ACTN
MAVGMREVAAHAGVSLRTVSNVVNDYPHVSPAMRERVQRSLDALGYRMNTAARSLSAGRTGMVALAIPDFTTPYFAELAHAVVTAAERRKFTVLIEVTHGERERELAVLGGGRTHLTDGVLLSPLALTAEDLAGAQPRVPAVLLGDLVAQGPLDHVGVPNREAARVAVEHLLALGRRRIAALGVQSGSRGTAALRLEGYCDALAAAGIRPLRRWRFGAEEWSREAGAAAVERMLAAPGPRPDAVFAFSDTLALGALRALLHAGVDVPGEVALVGFDDVEEARYTSPSLSSVSPATGEIAESALVLLEEQVERPRARGLGRQVSTPYALQVRESTAGVEA